MNNPELQIIIEAGRAERHYWQDIWRYRELFFVLSWRDITVKYKQTVIGIAWAVIRPILTMIVFTVIFGKVAKLPTEGSAPYAIMVYAAMLPWQFFATSLSESSNSLISNANLITKVYFPRLIIPASTVVTNLVDFFISFAILLRPDGLLPVPADHAFPDVACFSPDRLSDLIRGWYFPDFLERQVP